MRLRHTSPPQAGFSLIEVMVAVLVISIGLLGVAKMQALALASTGTAKMRSLAAIQAASLASTMRADRNYWSAITANPFTVTVSSTGAVSATDSTLNTAPSSQCATTCTAAQMAAYDLSNWASSLVGTLPAASATITCTYTAAGTVPVSCNIQLNWTENLVAINTSTNSAASQATNSTALSNTGATTYTLYVDP